MFIFWPYPLVCFKGTNVSTLQSIPLFKIFQHSVAVLFSSVLVQSIFAKYFLMSLCLPLWTFPCTVFFDSVLLLLWWYTISGCDHYTPHILTLSTNSFCELKTMSNMFSPLVGSNTCWVKKLSCTKVKQFWSSFPLLCRGFHIYAHG